MSRKMMYACLNFESITVDDMRHYTDEQMKAKWEELLQHAKANATGKGRHVEIYWLRDSFNEYLEMSDRTPGYSMGGQPCSEFNRKVLAGKIVLALGHGVGGTHELDELQLSRLKESLNEITTPSRRMHR